MKTRIIQIDPCSMDPGKLEEAAEIIRNGGLVAFPTETVYGLGADATDAVAVGKIFAAKGRPPDNPLIVHIPSIKDIRLVSSEITHTAMLLAQRFWPGPLTLVMKKSGHIPCIVTAGLDTVAVRIPSHPVAIALLEACGRPVAAPSANISGKPSPTDAQHVIQDLSGKVDAIIDAGRTPLGLESTVLDITVSPPVILRPGGVTLEQLEDFMGIGLESCDMPAEMNETPRSPGMKYRHYSPSADMVVVVGEQRSVCSRITELAKDYESKGKKTAIIAIEENLPHYIASLDTYGMGRGSEPETIARCLYGVLRSLDRLGYDVIIAEGVDSSGIGAAIMNRMRRASGNRMIRV